MIAPESLAPADALPVMPRAHAGARDPEALVKLARVLGPGPFAAVILFVSPEADQAAQQFPLAVGQEKEPPAPRLQTQPFKDVYLLRQGQTERLDSYGWTDRPNGIVHIPIERAMELTRERHAPARPDGQPSPAVVVQDSSSGRTVANR